MNWDNLRGWLWHCVEAWLIQGVVGIPLLSVMPLAHGILVGGIAAIAWMHGREKAQSEGRDPRHPYELTWHYWWPWTWGNVDSQMDFWFPAVGCAVVSAVTFLF